MKSNGSRENQRENDLIILSKWMYERALPRQNMSNEDASVDDKGS